MVLAISKHILFVIGGGMGRWWSLEGMVIFNSRSSGVGGHSRGDGVSRGDIRKDTWTTFYYGF